MAVEGLATLSKEELRKKLLQPDEITGSEILLRSLLLEGVECVFGYPGGAVLYIYDAMYGNPDFNHLLTRHEQGAIHAADGYARSTGKVGVCIATSGPGATNLGDGYCNGLHGFRSACRALPATWPLLLIGSDAFQEADIIGITMPITKHSYLVRDVQGLGAHDPRSVLYRLHRTQGPGVDRYSERCFGDQNGVPLSEKRSTSAATIRRVDPNKLQVDKLLQAIEEAERPVILAGGGVVYAGARRELIEFVEKTRIPVDDDIARSWRFPERS